MAETRHSTTIDIKVDDREIVRLGEEIERTFSTRALDAFTKAMERQSRAFDSIVRQQAVLQKAMEQTVKSSQDIQGTLQENKPMGFGAHAAATGVGTFLGHKAAHGHGPFQMGSHMLSGLLRGELVGSIFENLKVPYFNFGEGIGQVASAAMGGGQRYFQMAVGAARSRMGGFGKTGMSKEVQDALMLGTGVPMGINPMEMPGIMANLGQQTGLSGGRLGSVVPAFLAAQRFGGIESAGTIAGAAGAAGGRVSPERATALLSDTIGTALEAGVREARLDQYFQGLSGFVEQMRNRGILLEPESVNALVRGLGATNDESLRGLAGMMAAQQVASGLGKGMEGRGLMSAMLMKVTGVSTGGAGFFKARRMLSNNPMEYMPALIESFQKLRGAEDPEILGALMQKSFGEIGIQFSPQQAYALAQASPEQLKKMFGQKAAQRSIQKGRAFVGRRRAAAETMLPTLRTEAKLAYEEQRIGEAPEVGKMVETIHHADVEAVKAILPTIASFIEKVVHLGIDTVNKGKQAGYELKKRIKEDPFYRGYEASQMTTEDREQARKEYIRNMRLRRMNPDAQFHPVAPPTEDDYRYLYEREHPPDSYEADNPEEGATRTLPDKPGMKPVWSESKPKAATPKRAMDAAALHLRQAADLIGQASEGYDEGLSESEASGGN